MISCQNSDDETFPWMNTTVRSGGVAGSSALPLEDVDAQTRRLDESLRDAVEQGHGASSTSASGSA